MAPKRSYLVALGAALWSLDSLFRSRLAGGYSPFVVVFYTQVLCLAVVAPLCFYYRREILSLRPKEWLAFLFLAVASNVLAMAAFTYAFATTTNYSVPVLIQKVQPVFSILSAFLLLRERPPRYYFAIVPFALVGSYLIAFGFDWPRTEGQVTVILFSLVAAAIWGVGTTAGRFVSLKYPFLMVTSLRYGLSVLVLAASLPLWWKAGSAFPVSTDLVNFFWMAYLPGLFALFIYYKGMQVTPASLACWLELAYPLMAVLVNWLFLGSALNAGQIVGGLLLLLSVIVLQQLQGSVPAGSGAKT